MAPVGGAFELESFASSEDNTPESLEPGTLVASAVFEP